MAFESSPGDSVYPFVITVVLLLASAALVKLLLDLKQAILSKDWKKHEAVITEISVEETDIDEDGPTYSPKISYSYRIGGQSYTSNRFSYRQLQTGDYSEAASAISGLVAGNTVTVYVNPKRPKLSVVLPGADASSYIQPVLAGLFVYLAASGMFGH